MRRGRGHFVRGAGRTRTRVGALLVAALLAAACSSGSDASTDPTSEPGPASSTSPIDTSEAIDADSADAADPCAAAPTQQRHQLETIQIDNDERTYRLTVPQAGPGTPFAVLFAFQGGDAGDAPFPQLDEFLALGEEHGFLFVQPIGAKLDVNEGAWQLDTTDTFHHDIDFVEGIIGHLSSSYCVDPARIHATGYSLGSMFTYEIACQLNGVFASVASHAGSMPADPRECDVEQPIAVLHIHGMTDPIIPYSELWDWKEWPWVGTMSDAIGLVEFWSERNSCRDMSEEVTTGDVYRLVHDLCDGDVRVEHRGLFGHGHEWPSHIGRRLTAIEIWTFLDEFRR